MYLKLGEETISVCVLCQMTEHLGLNVIFLNFLKFLYAAGK